MTTAFRKLLYLNTRWCQWHSLVFFTVILTYACNHPDSSDIKIVWVDNKASAIYLPKDVFNNLKEDSITRFLRISLRNDTKATAILGHLKIQNNIIFEPLLPFSRGSAYEVFYKDKKIGAFNIPLADAKNAPELIHCYPEKDTLPENLLKIYLAFSHPMSEGQSYQNLTIIKNNKDTLKDIFLNLEPELWNEDRTAITIWLDPGRIKRDLQPNLLLGPPLQKGQQYQLTISRQWKDADGLPLQHDFKKEFTVGDRDSLSPEPDHWKLGLPAKNSLLALNITPDETLDHYLFLESLKIKDEKGATVKGKFEVYNQDSYARFIPDEIWKSGKYTLVIESRLEDLAGNNLNRPFDRDITRTKEPLVKDRYEIMFNIND